MENWIGAGIWIALGMGVGLAMRRVVDRPEETEGHAAVLALFGGFGAVIGGMLGVGIFHFHEPLALSPGGVGGALVFSALITFVYRWGIRGLI